MHVCTEYESEFYMLVIIPHRKERESNGSDSLIQDQQVLLHPIQHNCV